MQIKFAVRSETGRVRKNNEDNFFCNGFFMSENERDNPYFLSGTTSAPGVFAVCDGMGGEDCGELASLTAVQTLQEHYNNILRSINDTDESIAYECVYKYIKDTNKKLISIMRSQNIRMGAALVMAVAGDDAFTLYNLGDSRGFRVHDGRLLLVTDDHTVAAEKVRLGMMSPAKAEISPERNILMRYLGDNEDWGAMPDASKRFLFTENSGGLLCSDGLTDMLKFKDIADILKANPEPEKAVNTLVDEALKNGGHDNVTCLVFRID